MNPPMLSGSGVGALVRRGLSPNLLMQQSPLTTQQMPGSPVYQPGNTPPPTPPMPDQSMTSGMDQSIPQSQPQPQAQPQAAPEVSQSQPTQQNKFVPLNEGEHIVQALTKRLEAINKKEQPGKSDGQEVGSFDSEAERVKREYMALITSMRPHTLPPTVGALQEEHQRASGVPLLADIDNAKNRKDNDSVMRLERQILSMPADSPYGKYQGMFAKMLNSG